MGRAAHQVHDPQPIMDDPIALPILGTTLGAQVRTGGRRIQTRFARSLRAFAVARSKFAENELHQAMQRGVRQYVVLGAGLDTFAYRHSYPASQLQVYEVDHPNTQKWKHQLLNDAALAKPEAAHYVEVDFETQDFLERLRLAGFRQDEPVVIAWLGVSMYLSKFKVMALMQKVAACLPKGSTMVFDYITPLSQLGLMRRMWFGYLRLRLAIIGEPWRSFFDPIDLKNRLSGLGFTHVQDHGPDALNDLYYRGRTDNLKIGGLGHVMVARV